MGRLRRLSHNPKALRGLFCFVVRAEKAAGIKPNKQSLAKAQSVLYVNTHKVSRLNSSLYAVIPTILALPCQSITGKLSGDWILMAYTARTNSKKIHITSTFFGFDYSVHLNLCCNADVLTGIGLVAGIHECLSEFFCGTWVVDRYVRSIYVL